MSNFAMNEEDTKTASKMTKLMTLIINSAENNEVIERYRQELERLEDEKKYFFRALYKDENFRNSVEFKNFETCLPDMARCHKRGVVFLSTLREFLAKVFVADKNTRVRKYPLTDKYTLDSYAVSKIIRGYTDDLAIIKKRYGSTTIQLPKIAGLMTNLIVKYRPVIPMNRKDNPFLSINEKFAVYHALCVCSDFSNGDELAEFCKTEDFNVFFDDMEFLLNRNFTPESLIMIFKTLCVYRFKSCL
jgi:hypothetical protein